MFSQASVILFTWGVCIPACTGVDTHSPGRQPPPADTPPWADTSPLPPPTATAADGTHPTGMHSSCCRYCLALFPMGTMDRMGSEPFSLFNGPFNGEV